MGQKFASRRVAPQLSTTAQNAENPRRNSPKRHWPLFLEIFWLIVLTPVAKLFGPVNTDLLQCLFQYAPTPRGNLWTFRNRELTCLRMALEMGCKSDTVVNVATELLAFLSGVAPAAANSPAEEKSEEVIAACGTALAASEAADLVAQAEPAGAVDAPAAAAISRETLLEPPPTPSEVPAAQEIARPRQKWLSNRYRQRLQLVRRSGCSLRNLLRRPNRAEPSQPWRQKPAR